MSWLTAEEMARYRELQDSPMAHEAIERVAAELARARTLHPRFNSAHEGYAVILEEMDELKAEVWKREHDRGLMRKEVIQVAAMALRFLIDVCGGVE